MTGQIESWPAARVLALLAAMFLVLMAISLWTFDHAGARDTTGLSAQLPPELQEWTRGLKGKHGIGCCDDADGIDPIWDIQGEHYRVFYQGRWLTVDDDALLKMPNRLGVARAWIGGLSTDKPFVRCFLPGPTT